MTTVALPVLPSNFVNLLGGLGADTSLGSAFAPLLGAAQAQLGANAGASAVAGRSELPLLQAVQQLAQAQGAEAPALVRAFAATPLVPARVNAVLQKFSTAPTELKPTLVMLDHLEARLSRVGSSVAEVEGAQELTDVLAQKLNMPLPQAQLFGKAGAEALGQIIVAVGNAQQQPQASQHYLDADVSLPQKIVPEARPVDKAQAHQLIASIAKHQARPAAEILATLADLVPADEAALPLPQPEPAASELAPKELPIVERPEAIKVAEQASAAQPKPAMPEVNLPDPATQVAEVVAALETAPHPPVVATGAAALMQADMAQVRQQLGQQRAEGVQAAKAAHKPMHAGTMADLLADPVEEIELPAAANKPTPRAEPAPPPAPVAAQQNAAAPQQAAPQAAPVALRWQVTTTGLDVVQEVSPDEVEALRALGAGGEVQLSQQRSQVQFQAPVTQQSSVAEQAVAPIKMLIQQGGGAVRLQLNPAELGEIEIELQIKNGQVTGRIVVQNPEVLEHLARELHQLKQGLAESGLTVGEEGFVFLHREDTGEGGQQNAGQSFAAASGDGAGNEKASDKAESKRWIAADRLLDVTV